jgi:ABC-type branched-subunit amino acid transport system ATPase component
LAYDLDKQLEITGISKLFGPLLANDDVSLHVAQDEIVGLIGPNGSGKTTLFNCIVGHHPPDSGKILFEGRDITGCRVQETARLGILRTFQRTRTYHQLTCLENVQASLPNGYLRLANILSPIGSRTTSDALAMLDFIGLGGKRDALAGELSFGQRRLLELAMVLMSRPKLLLLDEPTSGISPQRIAALIERIRSARVLFGMTLLVIEHNMPVIAELADRIYCLNRGHVLAEGNPRQVFDDPRVADAYLGRK